MSTTTRTETAVHDLAVRALHAGRTLRPIDVLEALHGLDPSAPGADRLDALRAVVGALPIGVVGHVVDDDSRRAADQQTLTAGQLLERIALARPDDPVSFSTGGHPGHIDSWRGNYADLAVERDEHPCTVQQFGDRLRGRLAYGQITGYKGGEFDVDESTPVWVDAWGKWTPGPGGTNGVGITHVEVIADPDLSGTRTTVVILHTGPADTGD